jgi:hypothetical protein
MEAPFSASLGLVRHTFTCTFPEGVKRRAFDSKLTNTCSIKFGSDTNSDGVSVS